MTDTNAADAPSADIRPMVAKAPNNRSIWVFGGILTLGALGMFTALEARRSEVVSPVITAPRPSSGEAFAPPPELAIPQSYGAYPPPRMQPLPQDYALSAPRPAAPPIASRGIMPTAPMPQSYPVPPQQQAPVSTQPVQSGPGFAYQAPQRKNPAESSSGSKAGNERASASRLLNPNTTVPQGAVIQAILETALDSNRAGFARAIVSRDVLSFDGARVLIPKGSKLFGEYQADLAAGQNRALIQWRRLTRPDGGIIDLDSPSADPLGRAGVKGNVNSHFLARFGGTILQSALDIGRQLATRSLTGDNYILNVPIQNTEQAVAPRPQEVRPTLTVRQGTSVSVFVVRDLDFTAVEQ